MAPGTHAFIGWWVANVEPLDRRDRFVLFLAGVLPDLDGLPVLWGAGGGEWVGPGWYWNPGQWPLNGWANVRIAALGATMWVYIGVGLDRPWFEFVAPGFDREVCKMLRRGFRGGPPAEWWSPA